MFRLDGRTALVTGASGGIGAAIARTLHAQGANVVLSGTRREALETLAAELGEGTHACPADLRASDSADALVAAAEAMAGPLFVLVNNAGLTRDGLAMRMKDEDFAAVLEVDLAAPFRLCRAALRGMVRRRAGRIVNIGSVVGSTGNAGQANYAAAKAGVTALTQSLAKEVARIGITINAVCPGYIETEALSAMGDDERKAAQSRVPMRRFGQPFEVAAAVRFLACPEAGYITGSVLKIDGGIL